MNGFKETRYSVKMKNGETRFFPTMYDKSKYEEMQKRLDSQGKEAPKNTGSPFKKG